MDGEKSVNAQVESSAQSAVPDSLALKTGLNPFCHAIKQLHKYDPQQRGLHRFMRDTFAGKATIHAVRKWYNGQRNPPQWAVCVLRDLLLRDIQKMENLSKELEKIMNPPGTGVALKAWHAKRKAAKLAA